MAFLDPPYNVAVLRIVGRGQTKHREFAEASGEQSVAEFTAFLAAALNNAARVSLNGVLDYVCKDWRHIGEPLDASSGIYSERVNTAIWVKANAGQGSFYRSQHEHRPECSADLLAARALPARPVETQRLGRH